MADSRRYGLNPQLDIVQILEEAQSRWLRPAEICEILRNSTKFRIAPEPPNKPPSGSLFLFDRKVLRYFRKDGHNWRKKKDGKTVKEAHERLKSGSVDVLHCYYAHGEDNENFQRRSYWMLEEDLMHIVLVHYREVKGGKSSSNRARNVDDLTQVSNMNSPDCSNSNSITNQSQLNSQVTDAGSPNSYSHTSEYEDAESDNYKKSSRYNPNIEMQQYDDGSLMDAHLANRYIPVPYVDSQYDFQELQAEVPNFPAVQGDTTKVFDETGLGLKFSGSKIQIDLTPWEEILQHSTAGFQAPIFQSSDSYTQSVTSDIAPQADPFLYEGLDTYDANARQYNVTTAHSNPAWQISDDSTEPLVTSNISIGSEPLVEGGCNSEALVKQQSLDLLRAEGFKKYDSFSRWMSKEFDHTHITISSGTYWGDDIGNGVIEDSSMSTHEHLDTYIMSPSLSQDQLFSIIDFSPCWTFSGLEAKVLITGTFLKNKEDVENCKWSCMFGEIEVPAEVIGDGILRCRAPALKSGRLPFYVTCSNRLACSEVREFEYRENDSQHMETSDSQYNNVNEMLLHIRLDKLLSLGPNDHMMQNSDKLKEKIQLYNKINSIMKEEDNWSILVGHAQEESLPPDNGEDKLLEALLREKLHTWLLQKVTEDGKGPNIWDEDGQGVLHLAAALGYHWALRSAIAAGININFRDVHGWTALHWAAYCGRELTVVTLIAMDAAPGLLTDPTPEHPSGRTPADLAYANGHKGIAGFLAESFLTNHLETLTLKDSGSDTAEFSALPRFQSTEQGILQVADEDSPAGLALKDSLSAVRNASQAAAHIYQVFRVHSFHRKKLVDYENDKSGMSDERALSLLSVKSLKTGQHDMPLHAAAIHIQNKYRGWKGRKDFLIIRQRIVKIQAHVRGHQVRKHLRKIVWSVGIVEKVILRWRRKGCGLRGFRSEGLLEGSKLQNQTSREDDYDFLQEGRKQTEARLQKALDRVKSMVQYPEARDQYRRLLTVVTELQESKAMQENSMNGLEAGDSDVMIELEEFYEDDTFMANALH